MTLHEKLAAEVDAWRAAHYPSDTFPAIAEILEFASGADDSGQVRFLRTPQLRALETYWYLRIVCGTPGVLTLYRDCFPNKAHLLDALGLSHPDLRNLAIELEDADELLARIRSEDALVKQYKLEALRETLTLDYPSYIMALAMGAGKTILIAAIIATEFAMADEYPAGDFVQNALVFAPGKVILESLRELLSAPYDRILPPRFHKAFAASVKFTFTRDGESTIPVIPGSLFNVVVTNTEKIRIQKETVRKADVGPLLSPIKLDEARQEVANRRLQAIAALPHLAVFSDEAHHTYGQSMDTELKKVRKTVDYLHAETNLIVVVNTTGTPYFNRQPLLDVVIWYGLSEGIREGILKDVSDSIVTFGSVDTEDYVAQVVEGFFRDYRDVHLPNGALARLAIYFPQTDDLIAMRPVVHATLARLGLSPDLVLVNTSDQALTKTRDEEAFNRLNDPAQPQRVILLVNKGTEGWKCPSLFACALARKLRSSNNFVLQAATRCLRQVPGNTHKARIYLSEENFGVLDRQLGETYGERIATLSTANAQRRSATLVLRRLKVPPLVLTRTERRVVRKPTPDGPLSLIAPPVTARRVTRRRMTLDSRKGARRVLQQVAEAEAIDLTERTLDVFAAACELSARYRLDALALTGQLRELYPDGEVPEPALDGLSRQIEEQICRYDVHEERVEVALALVKPEGFVPGTDEHGHRVYTTEISYRLDQEQYLLSWEDWKDKNRRNLGFYYSPLDFDSKPEQDFFEKILAHLNVKLWEVEDIYFTGGLTDPAKTDFFVEYKTEDGRWHRYTPDFIIRKKPRRAEDPPGTGRVMIVEIKQLKSQDDPVDGRQGRKAMAVRAWENLNPDRVRYEMIFTATDQVPFDRMSPVLKFAEHQEFYLPIPLDRDRLAGFCRKWRVQSLEVFGSVLRSDFGPDSDVDFLYTLVPGAPAPGLALHHMTEELAAIVGRDVDLVSRKAVEQSRNWMRRKAILDSARVVHG